MSRATLESDMRDHPKWIMLSPLAYRLGVRLVLWAKRHSGGGFIPEAVVKEYAGTKVMARKLGTELLDCGKPFGKSGILEKCEGGYIVHDLLTEAELDATAPVTVVRPLSKSEAGRLGGQAKAARAASSLLEHDSSLASPLLALAEPVASPSTGLAAPDLTYQNNSGSGSSGSESEPPNPLPRRDRRKPSVLLPNDFALTEKLIQFSREKSWPEWWVRNRFDAFLDLARAKSWRYADWDAAFRNFLGNEIGYGRGPEQLASLAPKSGSGQASSALTPDQIARREARLAEQERADREHRERLLNAGGIDG